MATTALDKRQTTGSGSPQTASKGDSPGGVRRWVKNATPHNIREVGRFFPHGMAGLDVLFLRIASILFGDEDIGAVLFGNGSFATLARTHRRRNINIG
jgi:hypothetical protein